MWKLLLLAAAIDVPAYLYDPQVGAVVIVGTVLIAFIVGVFRSADWS